MFPYVNSVLIAVKALLKFLLFLKIIVHCGLMLLVKFKLKVIVHFNYFWNFRVFSG
jgi:hypothetical protein